MGVTNGDSSPYGASTSDDRNQSTRPKRIQGWLRFLIAFSFIILITALVFLGWLWWAPATGDWRRLLLSGYATQSVTIAALLIRTALATLAGIATSMIASISLESRRGVPLENVARVSVARTANGGPFSLFDLLFGPTFDLSMRITTALLVLITLASQFSSTILLTDLGNGNVMSFPQQEINSYTLHPRQGAGAFAAPAAIEGNSVNYWQVRPSKSEIFAEYKKDADSGQGDDVDDTGVTVRAFLPYSLQTRRETVHRFDGMTRVVDSRVVCVRPEIRDLSADIVRRNETDKGESGASEIHGTAVLTRKSGLIDEIFKSIQGKNTSASSKFSCPLVMPGKPQYGWVMCRFQDWALGIDSVLTNATSPDPINAHGQDSYLLWNNYGLVQSIVKHAKGDTAWQKVETIEGDPWKVQSSDDDGVWTSQNLSVPLAGNTTANFTMKSTMCFDAFGATGNVVDHLNIVATSPESMKEPAYSWSNFKDSYDMSQVLWQLGITNGSETLAAEKRKILTMSDADMQNSLKEIQGKPVQAPFKDDLLWLQNRTVMNPLQSISFCPTCDVNPQFSVTADMLFANLLDETVTTTGSPARGLQAIKTTMARSVYYDYIAAFTQRNGETATVLWFDSVEMPRISRGFPVVLAIVLIHVLLFFYVSFRFRSTHLSILDNEWHAVAQISQNPDLRDILENAKLARDETVAKRIRERAGLATLGKEAPKWQFWKRSGNGETPKFGVDRDGVIRARQHGDIALADLRLRSGYRGDASSEALTGDNHVH